ncbi:putative ubiquitin-like-specific protease 1B, partial [Hypsizygus marmoreus]
KELDILANPNGRLNDGCLNGVAHLLQAVFSQPGHESHYPSGRCAIFSTFDLHMVRYHASDADIWRRTRATQYWERAVWILPIHRRSPSEHWVLAIIYPEARRVLLFDSFAGGARLWRHEIQNDVSSPSDDQEIMELVTRLVICANRNNCHLPVVVEEGWVAQPASVRPHQTNGYDCGLWVLAGIAAVLRGFHVPGLCEADMPSFRELLHRYILGLPSYYSK